jgi:SAM-dependent methyltransferase
MLNNGRTREQIEEHYRIERELADRLRRAPREERRRLYSVVYDELLRRVPSHPMLTRKASPEQSAQAVAKQMGLLRRFLSLDKVFVEIGPGDCALAFEVCPRVKKVYAVEVSETISSSRRVPENFQLILSDGCSIPLPEQSVDIVYSNQMMEHLHPEDALEQLAAIQRVLRPGGVYVCITPNGLTGPHDISCGFDPEPTGFHLKEYSASDLDELFRSVGFRDVHAVLAIRNRYFVLSVRLYQLMELPVALAPGKIRRAHKHQLPFRMFQDLRLVGIR